MGNSISSSAEPPLGPHSNTPEKGLGSSFSKSIGDGADAVEQEEGHGSAPKNISGMEEEEEVMLAPEQCLLFECHDLGEGSSRIADTTNGTGWFGSACLLFISSEACCEILK